MTSCCCRSLEWHMPLFAPPLCLLPMWCSCCCAFRPVFHRVAMFRGLRGQNFGVSDGVVASRFSPCRRGLAHLKRVHSVVPRGSCPRVVTSNSRIQRMWYAGTSFLLHAITFVWRRLCSMWKRQAVSEQLQWLFCVQWMCNDCTWEPGGNVEC